jgi:hypothetical protein
VIPGDFQQNRDFLLCGLTCKGFSRVGQWFGMGWRGVQEAIIISIVFCGLSALLC